MLLPSDLKQSQFLKEAEFALTAIAVLAALVCPQLGAKFFERVERGFGRLSRRSGISVYVGLSVVVLRLALLPLFPIPLPFVPDDFSFLLACDTFAHGRLTNPTPAMWTHFESIHITMQPTYQSMYFPGQGLLLAVGQILFGQPWLALLAMDGLMCAALTWALQGWLPRRWALLGGMIAVLWLGLFSTWINTYHTAALLSAFGGALVLGSLPRLIRKGWFRYGLLMGLGIAILVLTRPYEGALLCLPVAVALGRWTVKGKARPPLGSLARRAVAPLLLIFAAILWLGYYDYKAFGNPLTLPYTINRQTYSMAPYYIWQHPRPDLHYRHAEMREFYRRIELGFFNLIDTPWGFVPYTLGKAIFTVLFFTGYALLPPLLTMGYVFKDRRTRFLVVCVLVMCTGLAVEAFLMPYYMAPFLAALYGLGIQSMRHLRAWKLGNSPAGLAMMRLLVVVCVAMAGIRALASPLKLTLPKWPPSNWNLTWYGPEHYGTERAQMEARLEQLPGDQLVIVRYFPQHYPVDEWVYNGADIDDSKVIWARDMGAAGNQELIRYYRDRSVWLVEPDAIPARVSPYPLQEPKP